MLCHRLLQAKVWEKRPHHSDWNPINNYKDVKSWNFHKTELRCFWLYFFFIFILTWTNMLIPSPLHLSGSKIQWLFPFKILLPFLNSKGQSIASLKLRIIIHHHHHHDRALFRNYFVIFWTLSLNSLENSSHNIHWERQTKRLEECKR